MVHHVHVASWKTRLVVVAVALLAVTEPRDGGRVLPWADCAQAQAHVVAPVGVDSDDQEAAKKVCLEEQVSRWGTQ